MVSLPMAQRQQMNQGGSYSLGFGLLLPFAMIMFVASGKLLWYMYDINQEQHYGENYYEDEIEYCYTDGW